MVRIDGRPIDYQTAVLRHIVGYPLSLLFFGLGIVWVLWDRRRQGWHDKLAKTVVIKERKHGSQAENLGRFHHSFFIVHQLSLSLPELRYPAMTNERCPDD